MNKLAFLEKNESHGGNLRRFSQHYNIPEDKIIDFSSNINPLGVPDSVRELYPQLLRELPLYPNPHAEEFCQSLAERFSGPPDNFIAGNGSLALLELAIRALKPKRALLIEPCFSEYRILLERNHVAIKSLVLREEENFHFPIQEILQSLYEVDLVILAHPNNPTGTALKREELLHLLKQAEEQNVSVIIDEAFVDWQPSLSVIDEVQEKSSFLVIRSMTKFFALAGIRSGFAVGPSQWINAMKEEQGVWSVNRIAEKLSVAAIQDSSFQEKTLRWFQEESRWLFQALTAFDFLKVYPSLANFFLIRMTPSPLSSPPLRGRGKGEGEFETAKNLLDFLGEKGICVRDSSGFRGLEANYFRVALRLQEQNRLLLQYLTQWNSSR